MTHQGTRTLETERLILRAFTEHDADAAFRNWESDANVTKCIIPFFFEEVGANRIESQHDPNNPNSGKVMQKCGMQYEGTLRQADHSNQGIVDACMYAILAEDYFRV